MNKSEGSEMKKGRILVTGGAGYVGAVLVPKLLAANWDVTVLDLFLYGDSVLPSPEQAPGLRIVKGDLRDEERVREALTDCTAVIHLACISNDPSFELNPELGKSINLDAFRPLVRMAKENGVNRFIYASSSSVYGIKDTPEVTEDLPLTPLTDYSRFKADCEEILEEEREPGFVCTTIRPATVCGWSPRLRLDLAVNILTNLAIRNGEITVFGGDQLRPNIHIEDMTDLYVFLMDQPAEKIDGTIFNAGYENFSINNIAGMVKGVVEAKMDKNINILHTPTDDNRSYHISSKRIRDQLGWQPQHTLKDAVDDLVRHFQNGDIPDSLEDIKYFNIKTMQAVNLS